MTQAARPQTDDDRRLSIFRVLSRTSAMLHRSHRALVSLRSTDVEEAVTGVELLAVYGRAVTTTLQNIRTYDRGHFDLWYGPWQDEMARDPLFRFMNTLRTMFLKEGSLGLPLYGLSSEGYKWRFDKMPRESMGVELADATVEDMGALYLGYLDRLVYEAGREFHGAPVFWTPGLKHGTVVGVEPLAE